MDSKLNNFADELEELALETAKTVKKQITQKPVDPAVDKSQPPAPSKKVYGQLTKAVADLAKIRLDKVREELEKQRLKVVNNQGTRNKIQTDQEKAPVDDAVQKMLKASKSTGEFGKLVGG